MHSPELMLLLHNVDWAELYDDLRGRTRGVRPGLARRAWSATRAIAARADAPPRVPRTQDCAATCAV